MAIEGDKLASKKQTPFSVWYPDERGRARRFRRASKKQTPFSVWYALDRLDRLRDSQGLKEADAFQRLVLRPVGRLIGAYSRLKEADAFQRLVCWTARKSCRDGRRASKKQTPFSVWYPNPPPMSESVGRRLKEADAFQRLVSKLLERSLAAAHHASKKQTPFSVWYWFEGFPLTNGRLGLKEADAFQRLVCNPRLEVRRRSPSLKEADAFQRLVSAAPRKSSPKGKSPQRSRRLSASGMDDYGASAVIQIGREIASKKQTPFSVWYQFALALIVLRALASKKQTPFSVWYHCPSAGVYRWQPGLKEADAFQRLV